jgi:hypothetical protein
VTSIRPIVIALVSLLALTALVAGCGGDSEEPPSASALVIDSAKALRAQKPARFAFETQAKVDELKPAAGANPQVQQFAGSPTSLGLAGAISPEAVQAKGSAAFGGQTFTAEALAGAKEVYVRFLGQWYGSKEFGLDQAKQQAEQQGGKSSDQAFNEAVANIERYGKDVFSGDVSEGPEVDGTATWQTEGTLNVDGLEKIAEQNGEKVTAQDREVLDKIAQGTTLTYVIGQEDKLPRQAKFALDIKPSEFADSVRDNAEDLKQVEQVKASFTVNMSKWGEPVKISPPASFQPIEQLFGQFLGGGAGAGSGAPGGLSGQ